MNFEQLPREIAPPADLEGRTVTALHGHGLLRQREAAASATWRRIAAAVVIFAAGAWFGMAWETPAGSPTDGPRFLLLLEGAATVEAGDEARVFEEYRAWAGHLRSNGRFVGGERLGSGFAAVPAGNAAGGDVIQGYFVVSAADIRDAVAVAESSPHVARGGRVVVRPINTP